LVFGTVEVAVEVLSIEPVARVEIRLDGEVVAVLTEPPYRALVDVGHENVARRFEVTATDASGEQATAVRVTGAVQVDEEVELELQQLYVTALRDGRRVLDLEPARFAVLDDGAPQKIVTFERGDVPLTAALLLDVSESMQGRQLAGALDGARAFVDAMRPLDQAMLLLFADQVRRVTAFTGFSELLRTGLEGVSAAGATAVNDHLFLALELLEARRGRRVVVLLSDGLDSASVLPMRDVLATARRSSALVYWLRLPLTAGRSFSTAWRSAAEHRTEIETLERTVTRSGGQIVPLGRTSEALAAFEAILEELRGQYVLGYYPTVDRDDGSWRRVRVRVDAPDVELRYRDGYLDD
jgi:Ca-activated chloride channel family protein